jgi:hypothetical protein
MITGFESPIDALREYKSFLGSKEDGIRWSMAERSPKEASR